MVIDAAGEDVGRAPVLSPPEKDRSNSGADPTRSLPWFATWRKPVGASHRAWSRGREQGHAHMPGSLRQIFVLGRKRHASAHGKFEIAGVISAQPFAPSQVEFRARFAVCSSITIGSPPI